MAIDSKILTTYGKHLSGAAAPRIELAPKFERRAQRSCSEAPRTVIATTLAEQAY